MRYNNQELLLSSAAIGFAGLALAYLVVLLLSHFKPGLGRQWHQIFSFSYSGTAFIAFILLVAAVTIEWQMHDEEKQIIQIIEEENDAVETLFLKSLRESKLLSITLKNRKVYVGFISQNFFTPYRDLQSIKIIPVLSGVRSKEQLKIDFTTPYESIVDFAEDNDHLDLNPDDFQIGLPISEIVSVKTFDFRVYNMFQAADSSQMQFQFE